MRRAVRIALITLAVLAVLILLVPLVIPVPPASSVPARELADPDSLFIRLGDLEVHYKTYGDGEPALLLLHGFASSTFSWREVTRSLSEEHLVVTFDRPSSGLTSRPLVGDWSGESPYSKDAQARLTVELMDALGIDEAVLVGNSAGGTIAVLTALKYPQRVKGLVLVDATIYEGGGAPAWLVSLLRTPQLRRIGPLLSRAILSRSEQALSRAWHDQERLSDEVLQGYSRVLAVENWAVGMWELTLASADEGVAHRLAEIDLPTLIVSGDHDRIVPLELSLRLADDIEGAQMAIIPECGHVPHEECPEAFLDSAQPFISGLRSAQ